MFMKMTLVGVGGTGTFCRTRFGFSFREALKSGSTEPHRSFSVSSTLNGKRKIKGIIIGPPGSGKGTVSERIVRDFKLDHLSSGDMLRSHIMKKTEFGVKIAPIVNTGGLVGIELLAPLIEHEIKQAKSPSGWLLDGYPRTVDQARRLEMVHPPNTVIYLNVPFQVIIERIKQRWVHLSSGRVYNLEFNPPKVPGKDDITGEDLVQREDDKPESVMKRLKVYQELTDPLLKYYKTVDILQEFSGTETNKIYPEVHNYLANFPQI